MWEPLLPNVMDDMLTSSSDVCKGVLSCNQASLGMQWICVGENGHISYEADSNQQICAQFMSIFTHDAVSWGEM